MNHQLLERATELAKQNYSIQVFSDELANGSVIYATVNPELDGCISQGRTISEALSNLADARIAYIYFLLEHGLSVPPPSSIATQSGCIVADTSVTITKSFSVNPSFEDILAKAVRRNTSKLLYEVVFR